MVSYNSILEKTSHIGTINKNTSRSELMSKFVLLMNDPIMKSFDTKTAETIHTHLSSFLDAHDTSRGEIYENCTNIVSMYLRKKQVAPDVFTTTLCRVQLRLREMLYNNKPFTVESIAKMITSVLSEK
jgi:hypothetical protein